jgi:hypothetical protein
MGDTYFIKKIKCAYCGMNNNFEREAAESGFLGLPYTFEFGADFICKKCSKKNAIKMDFVAVKPRLCKKLKRKLK